MRYEIRTEIDGRQITIECDERTAWVLQPLWAKQNPEATECRLILEDGGRSEYSIAKFPDPKDCRKTVVTRRLAPWADSAEVARYLGLGQ